MPSNLSSHVATSGGASFRAPSSRTRHSRLARWAIALALTTGLGVGVASTQTSGSHTSASHLSMQLMADSASTGVTGGPGSG